MPGVSVVIPVFNGAATLAEQLTAVEIASRRVADVEVVVADNGSTDGTKDLVEGRQATTPHPLRWVDASGRRGPNHARNRGVESCTFDRIVMCDADDVVDVEWLCVMSAAFDAGHRLVAGPIDYTRLNPPELLASRGAQRESVGAVLGFLPAAHGANLGFAREVFDDIGGFDESFTYGGDDVEFCWRAQLAGYRLHVADDAVVHYRLRTTHAERFMQARAYGASEVTLASRFSHHGVRPPSLADRSREWWWLVSRMPFTVNRGRRSAWLRRLAQAVGGLEGVHRERAKGRR